jgi:serpin B
MQAFKLVAALLCAASISTSPASDLPRAQDEALVQVIQGNNDFAVSLYRQLGGEANLFFSPYSIGSALAMTYAGARGQTADEMRQVLGLPPSLEGTLAGFGGLNGRLNAGAAGKDRPYEMAVANAIWGQETYPFHADFEQLLEKQFKADLRSADFVNAAEAARLEINGWVEQQTRERIKDLIAAGVLDEWTRMVLVNAIYFKGRWQEQFKPEATREKEFFTADGAVQVPTMHMDKELSFFEDDRLQALQLPYVGEDLAMLIFLPRERDGLRDLEQSLSGAMIAEAAARLRQQQVDVALPRFKMETEFELSKALAGLGMPTAFTEKADFSGISTAEHLFISAVIHKAFVEVNEEGTEAAAATGVVVRATAAPMAKTFHADHPFVFVIRDTKSGAILFMGRVADPR